MADEPSGLSVTPPQEIKKKKIVSLINMKPDCLLIKTPLESMLFMF
jgi:hypothetical protein